MRSLPRGPVAIAPTVTVGEGCVFGCAKEARLLDDQARPNGFARQPAPVVIGERCLVFNHVVIYEGSQVGPDCVIEDRVRIGYGARIGAGVRLAYGAYLCDRISVGDGARVAGFVCDGTAIGKRTTVMGQLVHEYSRPHRGWWEVDETSPVVEDDVVIGFGAIVIGGVRVGPRSYVAAGAIVTRDVPPGHIVTGTNILTPAADWRGGSLRELLAHWQQPNPSAG